MQKTDIVPELESDAKKIFDSLIKNDEELKSIENRMLKSQPQYGDVYQYANRIGELRTQALKKAIEKNGLPNDTMYYNIADRLISPALKSDCDLIDKWCRTIAEKQNKAARLGLNIHESKFDRDKADGIVEAISGRPLEEAQTVLDSVIVTNYQKTIDSFIRGEAELHSRVGLHPQISRIATSCACKWCKELSGRYDYPDKMPADVFRRHSNCGCTIEYWPGDGRSQNVHDKSWKSAEENRVTREDLEKAVSKKQRKFIAGPKAAQIRERIIDSGVPRSTETMERIVELAMEHPDSEIVDLMVDGTISPNMNYEASGRHIRDRIGLKDADKFDELRSEILADAKAAEEKLTPLIGSGKPTNKRSSIREIIYCPDLTGTVLYNGNLIETHLFEIHYSKSGWHAVPYLERS